MADTAKKTGLITCSVVRDYWLTDEQAKALGLDDPRVRAGTIVDVDKDTAIDGIESGSLSRVKVAK